MSERKSQQRNDPPILFAKPRAIKPKDKKALAEIGVIVVEVDDPQSVKLTRAHSEIDGGAMLMAALRAINESTLSGVKGDFIAKLMQIVD